MLKALLKVSLFSVVLAAIIAGLAYSYSSRVMNPTVTASAPQSEAGPAQVLIPFSETGNPTHDYLIAHPAERAKELGKMAGEGCKGRSAFYQVTASCSAAGQPAHTALWSVKCTNGKSYSVSVFPGGRSSVMDCALLEALHAGHCFTKMTDDSCAAN